MAATAVKRKREVEDTIAPGAHPIKTPRSDDFCGFAQKALNDLLTAGVSLFHFLPLPFTHFFSTLGEHALLS